MTMFTFLVSVFANFVSKWPSYKCDVVPWRWKMPFYHAVKQLSSRYGQQIVLGLFWDILQLQEWSFWITVFHFHWKNWNHDDGVTFVGVCTKHTCFLENEMPRRSAAFQCLIIMLLCHTCYLYQRKKCCFLWFVYHNKPYCSFDFI